MEAKTQFPPMDLKAKFVKIEVLEIGKESDGLLIDFSKFLLGNH